MLAVMRCVCPRSLLETQATLHETCCSDLCVCWGACLEDPHLAHHQQPPCRCCCCCCYSCQAQFAVVAWDCASAVACPLQVMMMMAFSPHQRPQHHRLRALKLLPLQQPLPLPRPLHGGHYDATVGLLLQLLLGSLVSHQLHQNCAWRWMCCWRGAASRSGGQSATWTPGAVACHAPKVTVSLPPHLCAWDYVLTLTRQPQQLQRQTNGVTCERQKAERAQCGVAVGIPGGCLTPREPLGRHTIRNSTPGSFRTATSKSPSYTMPLVPRRHNWPAPWRGLSHRLTDKARELHVELCDCLPSAGACASPADQRGIWTQHLHTK